MKWLSLLGLEALVLRWRAAAIEGAIAAEDRIDLAASEWRDQKSRLQKMAVMGIVLAALTVVSLVVLSGAVMVQFWDTSYRLFAVWGVAIFWLLVWLVLLLQILGLGKQARNGFALTRNVLSQDWKHIKERL